MDKWEYKTRHIKTSELELELEIERECFDWEVVNINHGDKLSRVRFKRKIQQGNGNQD